MNIDKTLHGMDIGQKCMVKIKIGLRECKGLRYDEILAMRTHAQAHEHLYTIHLARLKSQGYYDEWHKRFLWFATYLGMRK